MNNYALDTPTKRKLYIPKDDVPFAPVVNPPLIGESDSTHRSLTWLFHRPQDAAVFPVEPKSARLDKKK